MRNGRIAGILVAALVALGIVSTPAFAGTLTVAPQINGRGSIADANALPAAYTCANSTTSDTGNVSCATSNGWVPTCTGICVIQGARLNLTATPASGWRFVGWTGTPTGCTTDVLCSMSVSPIIRLDASFAPVANFHEIVDVSLTSKPPALTNSSSATIKYASPTGVAAKCTIDGSTFICPFDSTSHTGTLPLTGLADGPHTVSVVTASANNNPSDTPASVTWTVDTTPPTTSVDSGPAQGSSQTSGATSFTFSSNESAATFDCSIDGGAFGACSSPLSVPALAVGAHNLRVRSTDAAGNVGAITERDWSVAAPPAAPSPSPTPTAAPVVTQLSTPKATPLVVTLAYTFRASHTRTTFTKLDLQSVPKGATVSTSCPRGCAKKTFTTTAKASTVSLKSVVAHGIKAGTKLTVTVSKPGSISAVKVLVARASKAPTITTSCLAPGAKKPGRC